MIDQGARVVQEQVDGEEVLNPDNTSSVLSTVYNTIYNQFDHESLDKIVGLLNVHRIRPSRDDRVPGHRYSIIRLGAIKFLVYHVWAIWFIVRRWVWNADKPGALVADKMGFGKTFTSVAAAMLCKLVTEKVVMGLPLSILWNNTFEEWVILVGNDFPGIVGEEWELYLFQRVNSVPCRL
jgi:hypothetical protein